MRKWLKISSVAFVIAVLLAVLLPSFAHAASWWDSSWAYRMKLTFDNSACADANIPISPTGFNDPDNAWNNEANAYDNNLSSVAITYYPTVHFLELTTSEVLCSSVRFYASVAGTGNKEINLDVYYSGAWHDVYQGDFTAATWERKELGGTYSVTKARITLTSDGLFTSASLYEFDFETVNLIDFPVLVHLDAGDIDWTHVQNAGQDIRFVDDDDTTELDYEIEEWDDTVNADMWVEVPQIDAGSTTDYVYMYYGNTGASDGQNMEGTWNTNYELVLHMDDLTTSSVEDSTSNNNDGTKSVANSPTVTTSGQIGNAQSFDGTDDWIVTGTTNLPTGNSAISIEFFVKMQELSSRQVFGLWGTEGANTAIMTELSATNVWQSEFWTAGYATSAVPAPDMVNFFYFTATYDLSNHRLYLDGIERANPAYNSANLGTTRSIIGAYKPNAAALLVESIIDEYRISSTDLSADWIEAQYISMTDAMITFGSEEYVPPDSPTDLTLTPANDNQVNITWVMGSGTTKTLVRRKINSYPVDETDGEQVYYDTGTSYSDTANNVGLELDKFSYYYRAWGWNAAGGYSVTYAEGNIGGETMILLALFVLGGILGFLSLRNRSFLLAIGAGGAWMGLAVYVEANPPLNLSRGDPAHVMLFLALLAVAIGLPMISVARHLGSDRKTAEGEEVEEPTDTSLFKRLTGQGSRATQPSESAEEYRERVHRAFTKKRRRR